MLFNVEEEKSHKMPKKPGNWNSFNCSSPWQTEELLHSTGALLSHYPNVLCTNESLSFLQFLGTKCFVPAGIHHHFTRLPFCWAIIPSPPAW